MKEVNKRIWSSDLQAKEFFSLGIDAFYLSSYKNGITGLFSTTRELSIERVTAAFKQLIKEHNKLVEKHNELVELFFNEEQGEK